MDNNIIDKRAGFKEICKYVARTAFVYPETFATGQIFDIVKFYKWLEETKFTSEYDKLKEQNENLLDIASEYYLKLQVESLGNISNAIASDGKRAQLRNLISDVTGLSNEEIQLKFEKSAKLCKEAIKKCEPLT